MLYMLAFSALALVANAGRSDGGSEHVQNENRKGQLQVGATGMCLGTDLDPHPGSRVVLVKCLNGKENTSQSTMIQRNIFWFFGKGATKIKPQRNENLCVDAGEVGDFNKLFLAECDDNKATQKWWYTDDAHVAMEGQEPGQCFDLVDGRLNEWFEIQTYTCIGGNSNQEWNTKFD